MSLSTPKPVACRIAPVKGLNGSRSGVSKVKMVNGKALPPLQGKEKENLVLQKSSTMASRREMMHLTAASIGLLSLLVPGAAEARTKNASIRENIMKKFEELRQKAGLSKSKEEAEEKQPKTEAEVKKPTAEAKKPKEEAAEAKKEEKKPTADAEGKKPKEEAEEKKPKAEAEETKTKIESEEKKPKDMKNGEQGQEKKHAASSPESTGSKDEIPALPNILNDKLVETNLL